MYSRESIRERRQEWFVGSVEREVISSGKRRKSRPLGNYSTDVPAVTVRGLVAGRILIGTGSDVTLVNEEILRDCSAVIRATAADKSVITANGEPLELVGTAEIPIIIQEVVRYTVLVASCRNVFWELQAVKCVVDLNNNTLHLNGKVIPLQVSARLLSGRVVCSALVTIPGRHQQEVPVNVIELWTGLFVPKTTFIELLWLIHFELHFLNHSNVKSFGISNNNSST